jgi:hypothetical protein
MEQVVWVRHVLVEADGLEEEAHVRARERRLETLLGIATWLGAKSKWFWTRNRRVEPGTASGGR